MNLDKKNALIAAAVIVAVGLLVLLALGASGCGDEPCTVNIYHPASSDGGADGAGCSGGEAGSAGVGGDAGQGGATGGDGGEGGAGGEDCDPDRR